MKKIFLDTNILIDFVLGRDNGEAKRLLQLGCDKKVCLAASTLTFANMAYIPRNKVDIYELFKFLSSFIEVLPIDGNHLELALERRVRDFEDMLQYQSAKSGQCNVIVTNNERDFAEFCTDLPYMNAQHFLEEL
ncbi:MAG: PIN domain-containing protein [Bacteroidales bacterium]|nr:PIN domain-containing protein [Bacteroidales bacterium]